MLDELSTLIQNEVMKHNLFPFTKATDEFIGALNPNEVYTRLMVPTDAHYVKGFVDLFLKDGDRLLRRHSDTGLLKKPGRSIKGPLG